MITFNRIAQRVPHTRKVCDLRVGDVFILACYAASSPLCGQLLDSDSVFIKTSEHGCLCLAEMDAGLIDYSTEEGRVSMECEDLEFDELQGSDAYLVGINISSLTLES